jgi:DNA-binding transcriptional regulator YiaG
MPKYTPEEKKALAEAGKRLGLGKHNKKVVNLNERPKPTKALPKKVESRSRKQHHVESEIERCNRMVEQYKLKHLQKAKAVPAYDVTNPTRYPEVVMWNTTKNTMLDKILKRYAYVMKPQGITPQEFKMWRTEFMLMSPEQLGALVRVTARTIRDWENGVSRIPFAMWWVMHVTMQDPEYFLTRPGFHDFYIEYVDGVAYLCSHTWPDIRYTATDLYFNRCAFNEVLTLREDVKKLEAEIQEHIAENTRLRRMLKTNGISAELQAMHDHIGAMMKRIQTSDVMPFQPAQEAAMSPAPSMSTDSTPRQSTKAA